jgi:murein DD-endopeptidase MepM/ murein hydrolase activator NlpD
MFSTFKTKIKNKILLGLVFALLFAGQSNIAHSDEISDKLSSNQQKLLELNKQIKNYQQEIADTQSKSNTLKNEISIYNIQINSIQLEIDAKETQIENKNLQIKQLQQLIDQKTQEILDNKTVLSQLIVELNEYDDQYALKSTIGSDNLSSFLDQIQYTRNLQGQIYQLVQKIKTLKIQLTAQQQNLQTQVTQLTELKKELEINQNSLAEVRNQKELLLKQTQGLEKNYQKLLASTKKDADNLQKEINDLDAQIRAKLGKKTIGTGKGTLAWPLDGILTQKYGNTGFTALGYDFHNGIDIAAPAGRSIYAAADGVVLDTDISQAAFGNWVALKSTVVTSKGAVQIVTVYGHMRKFVVSPGDILAQGDLIGYEGNTGNTTAKLYGPERGYHIHFGVYDFEGFGVSAGKYTSVYGNYKVPYGYTYNPLDFLPPQ